MQLGNRLYLLGHISKFIGDIGTACTLNFAIFYSTLELDKGKFKGKRYLPVGPSFV